MRTWIAASIAFLSLLCLFGCTGRSASEASSRQSSLRQAKINGVYLNLRQLALKTTSARAGAPANVPKNAPYGVVMDLGLPDSQATVVATIGGHASIYLSTGGGNIGGEGISAIRNAAKHAVEASRAVVSLMKPAHEYPLPRSDFVQFFVLTGSGIMSASFAERDLEADRQPFSKLYAAMQDVITQYRLSNQ